LYDYNTIFASTELGLLKDLLIQLHSKFGKRSGEWETIPLRTIQY